MLKSNLSLAINIATEAHDGQIDRGGAPYILHPLRVMLAVEGERERIAAVLHDVAEDCPEWPLDRLRSLPFSGGVCDALDALTRRTGEDYFDFIIRCGMDPIARTVKLADLEDNMNLRRIKKPNEKDFERVQKYGRACTMLLSAHEG